MEVTARFLLITCLVCRASAFPRSVNIGGLFNPGDERQENAFLFAVERVNERALHNQASLHPNLPHDLQFQGSHGQSSPQNNPLSVFPSHLVPQVRHIAEDDSFRAAKRVCELMHGSVVGILGPSSSSTSSHVQSICDALAVPHIETRWDPRLHRKLYSINLYPHPASLAQAYLSLIRFFKWSSFCILYEESQSLVRLQELLNFRGSGHFRTSIRQLPRGENFREVLRNIKKSGETNILLDCQPAKIGTVLKQAQQVGMMSPSNNYIITSLDTNLVDMEDYKYDGTNITTLRLVDNTKPAVAHIMRKIERSYRDKYGYSQPHIKLGTETALMYDSVHMFVASLGAMQNGTENNDFRTHRLNCSGQMSWKHGESLINFMKMMKMTGLSGKIEFDREGFRTVFDLDILELHLDGFKKVGTWNKLNGVNYTRSPEVRIEEGLLGIQNKTLVVSFAFTDPYIMRKKSSFPLKGNDRFEGFCVSLLDEISQILHFNYTLVPIKDNVYGTKNEVTGEWNGMIRELLTGRADMAITDMTISFARASVVDFTLPFMNLGISLIYMKPMKSPPALFSFMAPFSLEVWMYTMGALIGISLILFILSRFSPYEWNNNEAHNEDPDFTETSFNLRNCFWFSIGSLMQQGCDFLPKAVSTRIVAGMWWFFTLIMVSSYTANLAAFLTVERMESPIESVSDLAKQTKIKYGAYQHGSTASFFRENSDPMYQKMWQFMNSTEGTFVDNNQQGYDRVKEKAGMYAFLSESTSIEYVTERHCELTQVGGLLDSKSYGIALTPGSPYKDALDVAILTLQATGRLFINKEEWWKQKHG